MRYRKAEEVLGDLPVLHESNRRRLYRACVLYGKSARLDAVAVRAELSDVDPAALSPVDLPWYYLLKGILADVEGELSRAADFFQLAEEKAASSLQSILFSSLIFRQKILNSQADGNLLVEIREKYEELRGQSVALPFLIEYVVLLHGLGRDAEAIRVLEEGIASVDLAKLGEKRGRLLLLKSLILGPESQAGWATLEELVRSGINSETTVMALQLMASVSEGEAYLMALLNEVINWAEPHPLLPQFYYLRSQLALANPETTAQAEADARFLLEQYPGLSEIDSVYRLLAYAAIQGNPPRYRMAADYLLELRERTSAPELIAQLNRLIGDCYFLNRDYANATDFYESANIGSAQGKAWPNVLLRLMVSQIRAGKLEAALAQIEGADLEGGMAAEDRWRIEWSIALALRADGQADRALERLRTLIGRASSSIPTSLDLQLRWLEAHISLQVGDSLGIADKLDALLTRIDSMPEEALDQEEGSRLKAELLLLQSEAMFAQSQIESAFRVIAKIREKFSREIAAQRTYFTEAAYHASVGDFGAAKQILVLFAQDYPTSEMVPQALFEAALHAQKQGAEQYGEAVVLLDRLVQGHPESDLVYYAGLKQGDLLRLMNNFAGAQLIYENLINRFPAHRLRYAAELSRADCIAALAQDGGGQIVEALSILERLLDQSDLPVEVQIEAGYKWGRILARRGESSEAKTVLGLVVSRYLFDAGNAPVLSSVGRYWLSRSIFSLCDLLEAEGELAEAERLYRKLVAFNLPGRSFALSRIGQLQPGGKL
ncbi:MAG: tetratricopeptide repeat protein [Opitutales bacterium]